MKRPFLILLFLSLISGLTAVAQDTIITVAGEEILATVDLISNEEVHYYKFGFDDGPRYVMLISEVFMIKLDNGTRYVYPGNLNRNREEQAENLPAFDKSEWYRIGTEHAEHHYSATEAFVISALVGFLFPLGSFPVMFYYGVDKPKVKLDKLPNPEYAKNEDFKDAYQKKAKSKNFFNAVLGTFAGISPYIIIFIMISQF